MHISRTEKQDGGSKLMFMPFEIVSICVWFGTFFQKHGQSVKYCSTVDLFPLILANVVDIQKEHLL